MTTVSSRVMARPSARPACNTNSGSSSPVRTQLITVPSADYFAWRANASAFRSRRRRAGALRSLESVRGEGVLDVLRELVHERSAEHGVVVAVHAYDVQASLNEGCPLCACAGRREGRDELHVA